MENIDWTTILSGLMAVGVIARMIVKFTPNQIDNKIVDLAVDILDFITIRNGKRSDKNK